MAGYGVIFTLMFTVFPNEQRPLFYEGQGGGGGHASFLSRVHLCEHTGPDLCKHFLCLGTTKTTIYFSFVELSQCHSLVHILQILNPHTLIVLS